MSSRLIVLRLIFLASCYVTYFAMPCHAEPIATGLSAFGIQSEHFQGVVCQRFLRSVGHSPKPAIAILYKTFGSNNNCLKQFWRVLGKKNVPHLTQIHFSNEVGRRNSNHDEFDFLPEYPVSAYNTALEEMPREVEEKIRERAREIVALIEPFKNSGTFILSTGLEDNYSIKAWQNIYRVLSEEWPYEIARSTLPRYLVRQVDEIPPEVFIEYHGYRSKFAFPHRCIANGDGQDVNFLEDTGVEFEHAKPASMSQVRRWYNDASDKGCVTFLWTGKWQGIHNGEDLGRPLKRRFRFDASDMAPVRKLLKKTTVV